MVLGIILFILNMAMLAWDMIDGTYETAWLPTIGMLSAIMLVVINM